MEYSSSAGSAQPTSRYFPETGCRVEGAFLEFFDRYGVGFCGLPISNRVWEAGVPTQYFQRLALEEPTPGQVRLKALGDELLRLRQAQPTPARPAPPPSASRLLDPAPFSLVNQIDQLPQHPTARYPSRPLETIRHLIIHHTGVPASVGPDVIAGYHVTDLNWPGIGYHFVVDAVGQVYQTNALTTAAYHARQFNGSGVGIALLGNFTHAVPPPAQLDGAAELCAWLVRGLDLPLDAVRGHRELIAVTCPGEYWLQGPCWKESLLARVAGLLRGEPMAEPAPAATVSGGTTTPWQATTGVKATSDTALPLPPLAPNLEPAAVMWSESAAASTPAPTETEAPPAPAPAQAPPWPATTGGSATSDTALPLPPLAPNLEPAAVMWSEAAASTSAPAETQAAPPAEAPAETAPVASVAPLPPTSWAESAEQSVAMAAMVAALNPPAPGPTDVTTSEATTTTTSPDAETAGPTPAPTRPWWMPVSEPFPAPEAAASTEPAASVRDTAPLDVTPPDAPQTDAEDIPFFPRPHPDKGESR